MIPGIYLARKVVTDAEPFHGAAAGIFDHDVGLPDQVRIDSPGLRVLQIQSYAQLVTEPVQGGNGNIVFEFTGEFGAVLAEVGRIGSATVTSSGIFDLDHFGAKARQNERGERSGERDGQIKDGDSIKGFVQVYFSRYRSKKSKTAGSTSGTMPP